MSLSIQIGKLWGVWNMWILSECCSCVGCTGKIQGCRDSSWLIIGSRREKFAVTSTES